MHVHVQPLMGPGRNQKLLAAAPIEVHAGQLQLRQPPHKAHCALYAHHVATCPVYSHKAVCSVCCHVAIFPACSHTAICPVCSVPLSAARLVMLLSWHASELIRNGQDWSWHGLELFRVGDPLCASKVQTHTFLPLQCGQMPSCLFITIASATLCTLPPPHTLTHTHTKSHAQR